MEPTVAFGFVEGVVTQAIRRPTAFANRTVLSAWTRECGPKGHPKLMPKSCDERRLAGERLMRALGRAVAANLAWRPRDIAVDVFFPKVVADTMNVAGIDRSLGTSLYAAAFNAALRERLQGLDDDAERAMYPKTAMLALTRDQWDAEVPGSDFLSLQVGLLREHGALDADGAQALRDAFVSNPAPNVSLAEFEARMLELVLSLRIDEATGAFPSGSASRPAARRPHL